MARAVPFLGWIPAALLLPLILLDAGQYEGYRAEPAEITVGAMVAAAGRSACRST